MSRTDHTPAGASPRLFGDLPQQDGDCPDNSTPGGGGDVDKSETGSPPRIDTESIKQAILHSSPRIRETALHYFSHSYTDDVSIMPLVIEALEKHGKDDAYMLVGASVHLPQTAETIDWLIRELNDPRSTSYESYTYNLQRILSAADPRLLEPRKDDIAGAEHVEPELHEILSDRIEMISWNAEHCWRELERHCEQYQSVASPSDAHLARGRRIVEALARYDVSEQRLLDLLARQVDPRADTPMKWMEPLLVHLAGRLRVKTAIPLLVEKMRLDDDLLLPECEAALVRIGGDAAVRAVAGAFVGSERRFRSAATGVLECVHTDLAVRSALELLPREADDYIARRLRWALLGQFTSEAIEPARQWLLERGFADLEDRGLRNHLLRVCEVLGETFPEYDQWSRNSEADERERLHALEQLKDDPVRSILWAMEQLTGKKTAEVMQEIEKEQAVCAVDAVVEKATRPAEARVGRNDPCPCGSGKKYKKCCLRNR